MSSLSPRQRLIGALVGVLLVVGAAWFFVVSPKRADAARLETELQAAQDKLVAAQREESSTRAKARRLPTLPVLTLAMPTEPAMSRIIRELNRLAAGSAIEFDAITPATAQPGEGFQVVPLAIELQGTFSRVAAFLERLRHQVDVRGGKLRVRGRLYSVESLQFAEGDRKFPSLKVTLTLNAFVYDAAATTAAAAAPTTPTGGEVLP